MPPTVSIVTPSFNQVAYLEETILSVLGQDYPNLEYIVIDGGSTDGSVDIIKKYAHRLAWWTSEPDQGQSHAVNKGFARATGDIFHWLNSDDLLMPSAVRIAASYLERRPELGVVYGDRLVIDHLGNTLELMQVPPFWARALPHHLRIPQETVFIRRQFWQQTQGLDEQLNMCMDFDLYLRLRSMTEFYRIPFILGALRQHSQSKSTINADQCRHYGNTEVTRTIIKHHGKPIPRFCRRFYKKANRLRQYVDQHSRARKKEVQAIMRFIQDRPQIPANSNSHTSSSSKINL
ncbi:glycosyltransferase family 2 protein [Planctomycetota bacterium]